MSAREELGRIAARVLQAEERHRRAVKERDAAYGELLDATSELRKRQTSAYQRVVVDRAWFVVLPAVQGPIIQPLVDPPASWGSHEATAAQVEPLPEPESPPINAMGYEDVPF